MTKTDKPERLRLHPSQLIAGALAAVTGAALSARLGVAGTLVGTAAISIISGIASAVYEHSVRRTRVAVVNARAKLSDLQSSISTRRIEPDGSPTADELGDPEPARPSFWTRIPRRRLIYAGAGALATFVLAIGIITSIELIHGKPLSGSGHGTTTISRAFESGGSGQKRPANPPASDTPSPSSSNTPSPSPSTPKDGADPSGQPSQSPSQEPSHKQSQKSSQKPTQAPSQQPSESPSAPESDPSPQPSPSDAPSGPDPAPTPTDAPSH